MIRAALTFFAFGLAAVAAVCVAGFGLLVAFARLVTAKPMT